MTYKWIPIKRRPLTEEERESILDYYGANFEITSNECVFDCHMPEDGQEILISTSWGVRIDKCEYDYTDVGLNLYSLEEYGDWDDVTAWMPVPEPYKKEQEKTHKESNKSEYDALKAENRRLTGELEQVYERLNDLTEKIKNIAEKHNIKATNVENLQENDIN